MPAQRTRDSKPRAAQVLARSASSGSTSMRTIAFAPTVTPKTYLDPPSHQGPPPESMLFPPVETTTPSRRAGHSRKKPENHIPRPPNAFILFRSSFIKNQHVSAKVETNHSTLSKIIGITWSNLPHDEREIWHTKAKLALDAHHLKFPQYAFRPLHTKGKTTEKRKVREVGPKDVTRCAKIAQLLVEGKKGAELNEAIAEFDRHHVPEIVTRFETPITARSFRRSSSAPAPDTEHAGPSSSLSSNSAADKLRSMSSQPEASSTPETNAVTEVQSDYAPSEPDSSQCTTPSSPYPTTPFSETNPSFDFSTFSFDSVSPASIPPPCNPYYLPPIQTQFDGFNMSSQQSPLSCTPQSELYSPMDLTYQYTNFYDPFASPIPSIPGTPCENPVIYSPIPQPVPSRVVPSPSQFEATYTFLDAAPSSYQTGMCAHSLDHMAQEFDLNLKLDYPSYGASGLAAFQSELSPPFSATVPTYQM